MRKMGRGQAGDGKPDEAAGRIEDLLRSFARRNHVTLAATRALFNLFGESDDAEKRNVARARIRNGRRG